LQVRRTSRASGARICNHPGCPVVIESGAYCSEHRIRVGGSRWLKLQKSKLRANPICEICERVFATEVDHIRELQDGGGEFDWDNLQSLCHDCHLEKSNERRRVVG
jgi:5-methylcytosine-specific restriction endonuclease McrA